MDNPYQSPEETRDARLLPRDLPRPIRRARGRIVDRIRLVAILMIVQGVFDLGMAILLGLMAAVVPWAISRDMGQRGAPGMENPEFFMWYMVGVYSVVAVLHLVPGVLHIWAGIRNYQCRGATFGIVSMGVGVVTIFAIMCAPTAIALAIFGMIVYFSEDAAEAFRLGGQGYDVAEIRARMG
jgi:hypothetical protein